MIEKINKLPFMGVFEFFFIKHNQTHLGRWSLLNESEKIFHRIDRSNVDNCGICFLQKEEKKNYELFDSKKLKM